ncbi:MAG TPA: MBL fold metallo-hydrolase [Candidatus Aenigmarchaeota archaeon]|nr:MAG: MBL fold metallo-hydrolase [Candidatus Aenigmarchaeota archaeon]HDD46450.1 MBL fold metallo-hydrolase [Candidatus Aenigmarchaeota archaeon]
MIELHFLGGANEVGREAILVDTGVEKFLLDYGVNVQTSEAPIRPNVNLDAAFLTHAHLDHSGFFPELYKRGYTKNIYATPVTFNLTAILLRDFVKVQKRNNAMLEYLIEDIKRMEECKYYLGPGQREEFAISSVEFFHAGHIPGSVSIMISNSRNLLYTGDIKFIDTKLMRGASIKNNIDVLISESTYSYTNHPNRAELEKRLKEIVRDTVENGGIALIPAFAVGRTQEILLILSELDIPVYIDGMGIRATENILMYPDTIKNANKLKKAFSKAHKIKKQREREMVLSEQAAIITTAGMLNGGPVIYYLENLYQREECSLILTGFQVPGTAGRTLLDTGIFKANGVEIKPKMRIEFLDFSAHTDHDHLLDFYNTLNPEKIILVHGDHTEEFCVELKEKGFDAVAPRNGEVLRI